MAPHAYQYRFAHHEQDSTSPGPQPPPHQPTHNHSSSPMFPNYTHSHEYPSPNPPYRQTQCCYPSTSVANNRVRASTASSPTPTTFGPQPSFSPNTSVSDSHSKPSTFFCVHQGCGKTYASPSTLKKHDQEQHCGRKVKCPRCQWEGARIHRHPKSCSEKLSFPDTEGQIDYRCGWCEKSFKDHPTWFKDTIAHQKRGELKSDYDHNVALTVSLGVPSASSHEPNTFNPEWMAGSTQFSLPAEEAAPGPRTPSPANAPPEPESDPGSSPGSDTTEYGTAWSPNPPRFLYTSPDRHLAMIDEFDDAFASSTDSDLALEDAPPSRFAFVSTQHLDPLPAPEDYALSQPPHRGYAHTLPLASPALARDNMLLAAYAPAPLECLDPRLTFSDTGGYVGGEDNCSI